MNRVSQRLKELHPGGFWLYVDNSTKSRDVLKQVAWLKEGGLLTVSDPTENGGFSDVTLPRLLMKGDVLSGLTLREFIKFLTGLNEEFLKEEQLTSDKP